MENAIARFFVTNQYKESMRILLVEDKTIKIPQARNNDEILVLEAEMGKRLLDWLSNKSNPININGEIWKVTLLDRYNERILHLHEPPKEMSITELQKHKVHVYYNLCGCEKEYHNVEFVFALMRTKTGKLEKLVIQHCLECLKDNYFINIAKLKAYYNQFGDIPLEFICQTNRTGGDFNAYGRSNESILKINGYASYLSEKERQSIVSYVLDTRQASKQEIINLLEVLISTNGRRTNMESSCQAWQDDLRFTLEYDVPTTPKIFAELC